MDQAQEDRIEKKADRRAEDINIKAFGVEISASGRQITHLIVSLLGFSVIATMVWSISEASDKYHKELAINQTTQMEKLSRQQVEHKETLDAILFMLSLPMKEREKLRMDMPESLRKKLSRERDR